MTDSPRPDLIDPSLVQPTAAAAPIAPALVAQPLPSPSPVQPSPAAPAAPAAPAIEAPIATSPLTPVVTIDTSAAKGLAMSVATGVVRVGGAFLIAHGAMTQAQVSAIGPIVAQEIAGTALLVAGQCWASLREWLSHQKKLAAAFADPSTIVLK